MLVMTMLLMMAPPVAERAQARHPARVVRTVKLSRKARRVRRPISLSVIKPQSTLCGDESVCVTGTPQSRYRLPLPQVQEPTDKEMALAEDGTRCALIGQTICQGKGHTIVQIGEPAPGVPAEAVLR